MYLKSWLCIVSFVFVENCIYHSICSWNSHCSLSRHLSNGSSNSLEKHRAMQCPSPGMNIRLYFDTPESLLLFAGIHSVIKQSSLSLESIFFWFLQQTRGGKWLPYVTHCLDSFNNNYAITIAKQSWCMILT